MPRSILYARLLLCCGLIWRILAFSGHYLSGHTQRCASKSSLAATQEAIHTESSWVLLAEDDKVLRNKIGENLANEGGYTVTGVADARSAILVCRGAIRSKSSLPSSVFIGNSTNPKQPDCLVIDVSLPGTMNGIDLLKVVRSDPLLEFLPVVLLSERGTAEDRLKGYDAGADAYLSKPFDLEELQSLIDGVLKRGKTSARRHLDNDESDNLIMKTDELRRELAEIKSLLVKSGLNTTTALDGNQFDDKDGSIQQDLVEIKDTILKAPSSDTQSAEESGEFIERA